jgi:hypothetical protein
MWNAAITFELLQVDIQNWPMINLEIVVFELNLQCKNKNELVNSRLSLNSFKKRIYNGRRT